MKHLNIWPQHFWEGGEEMASCPQLLGAAAQPESTYTSYATIHLGGAMCPMEHQCK